MDHKTGLIVFWKLSENYPGHFQEAGRTENGMQSESEEKGTVKCKGAACDEK